MSGEKHTHISLGMIDCKDKVNALEITFKNPSTWDVTRARIYADKKTVGYCVLANASDKDTVRCEIDELSGMHDIEIDIDGNTQVYSAKLIFVEDFTVSDYVPTSDRKIRDLRTSEWEATDMLGRHLASVEDTRGKKDKKVGIFYWTWRDAHKGRRAVNVTKLLEEHPAAEFNMDHPAWGEEPLQAHWNEPLYGFYLNSDDYVIRKHAIMLSNAGVDFIVFDCTNGNFLWKDGYEPLLEGLHKAREDGINVPKVVFMLNFAPFGWSNDMLRVLYQDLYRPHRYSDLWFMLDGKPLIMAYPEAVSFDGVCDTDTKILKEIREFFTFRPGMPGYHTGPTRPDHWPWLETYPQFKYGTRADGSCEMMSVGVAQNANDKRICTYFNDKNTYGRSYTHRDRWSKLTKDSYKYGYNFEEQWERALDADPDIIFITGWNEWQMGRIYKDPNWQKDPDSTQIAMVDQYDREHSRDIEPDIDGYLDTYYLQMVHNIRRFKGSLPRVEASGEKTIDIRSGKDQWRDVLPEYLNARGGACNRDCDGYSGTHYVNSSAQNNIVRCKVARDADNVYFYAECADKIVTSECGCMTLYIDSDRSHKSGWEGYDLVINRKKASGGYTDIERHVMLPNDNNAYVWEKMGRVRISTKGNTVMIEVPRNMICTEGKLSFEFKWSDNMQENNIMDLYKNGDCAPMGRFNYLYCE